MRAWEQRAFARGASALALMENAACAVRGALEEALGGLKGRRILFLCGGGNNGGDGLAAARLCGEKGAEAAVWLFKEPASAEAKENHARLGAVPVLRGVLPDLTQYDAAVDALFGTGLSQPLEGVALQTVRALNAQDVFVLSVDIPSGMDGLTGEGECVRADMTLSLGCPKAGVLLAGGERTGIHRAADIGLLEEDKPEGMEGCFAAAEESDLPGLLPPRRKSAHKGSCGRVLLLAGRWGMAGAAAMAAKACLRGGAGLVTVACGQDIEPVLQTLVPNAMCCARRDAAAAARDVLAAGCGLGVSAEHWALLRGLMRRETPTVLDADALTMLADAPAPLPALTVITPHIGEAARLLNCTARQVLQDRVAAVKALHARYGCAVMLKSAATLMYDGARFAVNTVGTPALAKGGSGDALTGILAAVLAQQKQPGLLPAMQAAALWLGLAGQEAQRRHGVYSVLTDDVIDCMGPAYLSAGGK